MPNDLRQQSRSVGLFEGRAYIMLLESVRGRRDPLIHHGVVRAPAGMSIEAALQEIDRFYNAAVEKDPDHWCWDDVFTSLQAHGFDEILAATWWEDLA
jgi:hypothetical protein